MFLNRLNEEEKIAFLELANYVARVDDNLAKSELEIIEIYSTEMNIENVQFNINDFVLEQCLDSFTDEKSKKIVLIELMALVYSDDYLHDKEKQIIEIITKTFCIDENTVFLYTQWAKAILALYIQGNALLKM